MFGGLTFDKRISGIQFGILSPDEIRKMSVARIIVADTYDEDGTPVPNGLMDPKLGVIDPGQRCSTCGNRVGDCPGHFGSIELSMPVVAVGFNKHIYKILRATCGDRDCGRIKISEEEIERYTQLMVKHKQTWGNMDTDLIERVLKLAAKAKECPHCGKEQQKIRLEKPVTFYEEREAEDAAGETQKHSNKLSPLDIFNWLSNIPNEDCVLLGVNPAPARPEWMILTVLPVPPVQVRPSITLESGIRSEDDLTHKLVDIIRINQRLQENREAGAPQLIVEDLWELLSYHVCTFLDNELSGIPPARHRSGRALRTLPPLLPFPSFRFRSNLSGKRVDFSARTVISPDPLLSINEVGVPRSIAQILTVPERITEWNIEQMKELVMRGPSGFPGANYIIRSDERRVDLRFAKEPALVADTLQPGFIIERHLRDGDVVMFNRQPSLHRMSIMAHEGKVMPYKTFRLNLTVCRPYNADFDGDEMNLHVPQSEEAQAEARILMLVSENISTPRYGGPIVGAVQDFITGVFYLTKSDTTFNRAQSCQLLAAANLAHLPEPDFVTDDGEDRWNGRTIFSLLLPDTMNFTMKSGICELCKKGDTKHLVMNDKDVKACPKDGLIIIRNGVVVAGAFDKKAVGAEQPESVLHRILKEFGSDAAKRFLDSFTRMSVAALTARGFTISIKDVDIPENAKERIDECVETSKSDVLALIDQYKTGELERLAGRTLEDTLEAKISAVLSKSRNDASSIAGEYLGMKNSAVVMATIGARGSMMNLGHMAANVGQQSVRGERIERGYRGRTLPHFRRQDLCAEARGFVTRSFRGGLTPIEFFFHAAGGREGLVDTAVRTSTSGYMQRRLINALQDISAQYDGTIRNAMGDVVQFKFGEDGIDPAKSDHGKPVNLGIIIDQVLSEVEE